LKVGEQNNGVTRSDRAELEHKASELATKCGERAPWRCVAKEASGSDRVERNELAERIKQNDRPLKTMIQKPK